MPNYVHHAPHTFEKLVTISNCHSIEDAARRAFRNKRFTDAVAFLRETNGRTVNVFLRIQDDDGNMSIRKLESFSLGRKSGGRFPLHTVPDLFLKSPREIFKYYVTAERVVDAVVNTTPIAPSKRVSVRRTGTKNLEASSVSSSTSTRASNFDPVTLSMDQQKKLLSRIHTRIKADSAHSVVANKYLCI